MAAQLEACRTAIAKMLSASIGDLRHKQRLEQAETVRRSLQTQGFDTRVTLAGADQERSRHRSPQLTGGMLDRITSNLSMGAGSFLEAWQKLGCVRVTFTNNKQKWAYELPPLQDARAGRERAGRHGPGRAARAAVGPLAPLSNRWPSARAAARRAEV